MAGAEPAKQSDLGVRAASAVVMLAVAGTALWLGGWVWTLFVALVALGVLWEWTRLVRAIAGSQLAMVLWQLGGAAYVGIGATMLALLRGQTGVPTLLLAIIAAVIATDIGAYFAGRAIGGPKIAPRISPSKTWAGLGGGMIGAAAALWLCAHFVGHWNLAKSLPLLLVSGPLLAVVAQSGDFFESWLKRRAGVKDSGHLIPGHGGLFDRVDGLLAVCFVLGLLALVGTVISQ